MIAASVNFEEIQIRRCQWLLCGSEYTGVDFQSVPISVFEGGLPLGI
jgi:hypothetical protein